jgi:hypothetical protein
MRANNANEPTRRNRSATALSVLLICLALLLPEAVSAQARPRSVSGVVRDSAGRPLGNAGIALDPDGSTRATRADNQGRFLFENVAPGTYTIRFTWIGFQPENRVIQVTESGLHVEVTLAPLTRRLDTLRVVARRTGIFGTVISSASMKPVQGATIEVMGTRFRATSTVDGTFSFPEVVEGGYVVSLRRNGFSTRLISVAVPNASAVEVSAVLDSLSTRSAALFEGRLRDMEFRIHRRTKNISAIISRQELSLLQDVQLNEALQYAPSIYSRGLIVQNAEVCNLYVDGRLESFLTIKDFRASDIEMIEVYGNVACREMVDGRSVVRRSAMPGIVVYLWKKR